MNTESFFAALWDGYVQVTPQAQAIYDLFTAQGETVVNDHVAFRTLSDSPLSIDRLAPVIEMLGYRHFDSYRFEQKKLLACSYNHLTDRSAPKIFLSELQCHLLSPTAREILDAAVSQIAPESVDGPSIFWRGPLWAVPSLNDYLKLLRESDYAAWLVTMGLRANHFTVSLNHLRRFTDLTSVIELLKRNNHRINPAGGEIKGSPQTLLEQASTVADRIPFIFADGATRSLPSCYYEFAKRYPGANGELFQGFVTGSADKIFESTQAGAD